LPVVEAISQELASGAHVAGLTLEGAVFVKERCERVQVCEDRLPDRWWVHGSSV